MNTNHDEETPPRAAGTHAAMSLRQQMAPARPLQTEGADRAGQAGLDLVRAHHAYDAHSA